MSFNSQGFFGKDMSRQVSILERASKAATKEASNAHRLKTGRVYGREKVRVEAGSITRIECVDANGPGCMVQLPAAGPNQGESIVVMAAGDSEAPHTKFTVIPAAEDTVDGQREGVTYNANKIRVQFVADGDDWGVTSNTSE